MKFQIVVTTTVTYEVTKEALNDIYNGAESFQEALEMDIENAKDDPYAFLDGDVFTSKDDIVIKVTGSLIPKKGGK